MSEEDQYKLLATDGMLVKRPILLVGGEKTPEGKPIMTKKPPCKDLVVQVSEMLDAYIEERKIQA